MEFEYNEEKGHDGAVYRAFNCGWCGFFLANDKSKLANYCTKCGTKIDKNYGGLKIGNKGF